MQTTDVPAFNEADALNYEPFYGDETDVATLSDKFVNGRKAYQCQHCYGPIQPGERHRALTERNNEEHKVMTFRFCPACCHAQAISDDDSGDLLCKRMNLFRPNSTKGDANTAIEHPQGGTTTSAQGDSLGDVEHSQSQRKESSC